MMPTLIKHIETYLGLVRHGWFCDHESVEMPFQVAEVCDGMAAGISSFVTIGLSDFELRSTRGDKAIRHELFMAVPDDTGPKNIPAILQGLGREAIDSGKAFIRGQLIGGRKGEVIAGTKFTFLYVAMPAYWPDEFATCVVNDHSVIFAWLVPITANEANFVKRHGWNAFEDSLSESSLDMCDLNRSELSIAGNRGNQGT